MDVIFDCVAASFIETDPEKDTVGVVLNAAGVGINIIAVVGAEIFPVPTIGNPVAEESPVHFTKYRWHSINSVPYGL